MKHALDRLWLLIISSQLQTTYSSVSPGRLASAQQTADLLHLIKVWLCGCMRRTRLARPMQQVQLDRRSCSLARPRHPPATVLAPRARWCVAGGSAARRLHVVAFRSVVVVASHRLSRSGRTGWTRSRGPHASFYFLDVYIVYVRVRNAWEPRAAACRHSTYSSASEATLNSAIKKERRGLCHCV